MFASCRLFLFFQLCTLIGLLPACSSSQKTPSKEEILAHLNNSIAPYYKIVELEHKNFASLQQEGVGRTSISGEVELTEDLYSASRDIFKADLEKFGIRAQQAHPFYPYRIRKNQFVYFVSESKGKHIKFSGELSYAQTANGFTFSGAPKINVTAKRRGELPSNSLVNGSPEYIAIIDNIKVKWKAYEKRQDEIKREIDGFFSGSPNLTYQDLNRKKEFEDRFLLRVDSPIQWSLVSAREKPLFSRLNIFFLAKGEISWITDGRLKNSSFKAQDITPVLISGGIYGAKDDNDSWKTSMGIYIPDPRRPDGFSIFDSQKLDWNGSVFQWVWVNGTIHGRLAKR